MIAVIDTFLRVSFRQVDDVTRDADSDTDYEDRYLREQLITYIGNKRALLPFIGQALERVRVELGRKDISAVDLFSGSGVVSRFLKGHCRRLIANDLELYSEVINRCYLSNRDERDDAALLSCYRELTDYLSERERSGTLERGIIARHYAPQDDDRIQPGERVFYTQRNARYIDTARRYIDSLPRDVRPFFLAPLLAKASVHANTAGVFKGFYKDRRTGIGRFGGTGRDALSRITGNIHIPFPLFSPRDCDVTVLREDANVLASRLADEAGTVDLVYLDPPYNQHPYGSNYFMLNLIARYREPESPSAVSGIPADWNRSRYNSQRRALAAFEELVRTLDSRYLLVSFNDEGFLDRGTLVSILETVGTVTVMEQRYNAFRGSRNLRNRSVHVRELLFLVTVRPRRYQGAPGAVAEMLDKDPHS